MKNLQISTLSVMVGSPLCNLKCPYCISKQTYRVKEHSRMRVPLERIAFLADKFMAVRSGLPFGILTGKGEPTLAPREEIGDVISVLYAGGKGLIPELQTNGTRLNEKNLGFWREKGLNTVALSCVSHLDGVNSSLLSKGEIKWNLGKTVRTASDIGLLVRLTVILTKGGIENTDALLAFLEFTKENGAHQVTFRKMGEPRNLALHGSLEVAKWIRAHNVKPEFILNELAKNGKEQASFPWAQVFTYDGLSVVVTDHMNAPKDGVIRHAVIQPDGHLYGSWDDPGDILI